jgi:hypothetical protein
MNSIFYLTHYVLNMQHYMSCRKMLPCGKSYLHNTFDTKVLALYEGDSIKNDGFVCIVVMNSIFYLNHHLLRYIDGEYR